MRLLPGKLDGYRSAAAARLVVRKTRAIRRRSIIDSLPPEILRSLLEAVDGESVLDFGGAAGFHCFVARQARPAQRFRWAVVETPVMIESARRLEDDDLKFFTTPESAADWLGGVDFLHSNGAIQYLDEPEPMLRRLLALQPRAALWARALLGESRRREVQIARLKDHGPGRAPRWLIDRQVEHHAVRMARSDFFAAHAGYDLVWERDGDFLFRRSSSDISARPESRRIELSEMSCRRSQAEPG